MSALNRKITGFLGLIARSGNIIYGEQLLKSILKQKVSLVILSKDVGVSVAKKITDKCKTYQIEYIQILTKEELSQAIGKQMCSAVGIKSIEAAQKIRNIMKEGE